MVIYLVVMVMVVVYYGEIRDAQIQFLYWLQENAYSGPMLAMFLVMLHSAVLLPTDVLVIGTGIALDKAHDEFFQSFFVGTLAVWTGFWIGTSLNARFLQFLFKNRLQPLINKSYILQLLN